MCKYCVNNAVGSMGESLLNSQTDDLAFDTFIDDNMLTTIVTGEGGKILTDGRVVIRYCPMCGEKLKQRVVQKFFKNLFNK